MLMQITYILVTLRLIPFFFLRIATLSLLTFLIYFFVLFYDSYF